MGMASTQEESANVAVTAHRSIAVVVGGSGAIAKALVSQVVARSRSDRREFESNEQWATKSPVHYHRLQ